MTNYPASVSSVSKIARSIRAEESCGEESEIKEPVKEYEID